MIEIKFRAWEEKTKFMIPVNNIDFRSQQINIGSAWRFLNEVELMQYTGFNDKNNKEIYEGDILEFTEYPGENYYAEICKSDEPPFNFIFQYVKKPNSYVAGISSGICYLLEEIETNLGEHKVIGNIYENKELLEEK